MRAAAATNLDNLAPACIQFCHIFAGFLVAVPVGSEWPRYLMQRACQCVRRVYFCDQAAGEVEIVEVAVVVGQRVRFSAGHRYFVVGGGGKLEGGCCGVRCEV